MVGGDPGHARGPGRTRCPRRVGGPDVDRVAVPAGRGRRSPGRPQQRRGRRRPPGRRRAGDRRPRRRGGARSAASAPGAAAGCRSRSIAGTENVIIRTGASRPLPAVRFEHGGDPLLDVETRANWGAWFRWPDRPGRHGCGPSLTMINSSARVTSRRWSDVGRSTAQEPKSSAWSSATVHANAGSGGVGGSVQGQVVEADQLIIGAELTRRTPARAESAVSADQAIASSYAAFVISGWRPENPRCATISTHRRDYVP